MAPAPSLFFMALGRYRAFIWYNVAAGNQGLPSSGIMWQVGIKACSCTIWLAVSLNLGNQAAFKTREVPVLPLIQSEFWVLSLVVDQKWLPYAPSWHRIPSSLQGATCFLEGSLQNKFLLFLPCFPSPPHCKGRFILHAGARTEEKRLCNSNFLDGITYQEKDFTCSWIMIQVWPKSSDFHS